MSDVVFFPKDLVTADTIQSPSARLLYWVLSARAIGGRAFNVTRAYLSTLTGFHVDKVSKLVGELRRLGLVRTYHKGPRGMAYYLPRGHRVRCTPGKFVVIPRIVIMNRRLSAQARVIYVAIKTMSWDAMGSEIAVSRLEEVTGFSGRTVSRHVTALSACGLLKVTRAMREMTHYVATDGYREVRAPKRERAARQKKTQRLPKAVYTRWSVSRSIGYVPVPWEVGHY